MATFQEDLAIRIYSNPKFKQDVNDLLRYYFAISIQKDLTGHFLDYPKIKRLAQSVLIMASSPENSHKKAAFELATLLFESQLEELSGLNGVMKLVCTRLGNAPSVNLIDSNTNLPLSLDIESELQIAESTINLERSSLKLTKFQLDAFNLLSQGFSVSLSAPTSAGKSFLITHFVANKFLGNERYAAVVLVPTRALIRQLIEDFQNVFREYNYSIGDNFDLVTSSIENGKSSHTSKQLFILTQERLQAVLYNWENKPSFDLLVVDESQKIADSKRGIILEDIIMELTARQRDIQCIFLSPMSSNPDFLFGLLNSSSKNQAVYSVISPVAQHVYSVKTRKRSITVSRVNSEADDFKIEIKIDPEMPTTRAKRIAYVAKVLGKNSSNILYASGPTKAEENALALAEDTDLPPVKSSAVQETIDYLSDIIHEEYHLITCLKKGIGYHYGSMPDIAKIGVEDLFKDGSVSYVSCTSTLLEGVNLPAKNIFIEDPKLGYEPMDDSSFWNLAGRAGRLMKELSGNVYCINQDRWEKPATERKKEYKIESSLTRTLSSNTFVEYCQMPTPEIYPESYEQAMNSLVLKYMDEGEEATKVFVSNRVPPDLREILLSNLTPVAKSMQLPVDVLKKNKSIDVRFQQNFYKYLSELSKPKLLNLIPRQPFSQESYDILGNIFQISDKYFTLKDRGRSFIYYAVIASQWIREQSLKDMIVSAINYQRRSTDQIDVNKVIRDLIKSLNNEIRFYYVRNTKCFCDLLQFELDRRQITVEDYPAYSDFGLPNYLELGMSNPGTIQLHNVGLSRTTAIEVNTYCRRLGVEANEILNWVRERANDIAWQLPRPLRVEILEFFT